MKRFDVAVIGGGVLGCFAARNLMRWHLSVGLIEKEADVCTGITRANSAIVYAGYDNRPGSLKASMTVAGNRNFDKLCSELDVPFSRCGSLMVTYDSAEIPRLRHKLDDGTRNGVPGLCLLSGSEAEEMEPSLRPGVSGALYAPTTGTVNPWMLGIAAFENAIDNGAVPMLGAAVKAIDKTDSGYRLTVGEEAVECRAVVNCAGLFADRVSELLFAPDIRLQWDGAEFIVFSRTAPKPGRIIFQQASKCGKGITAVPCAEGNLLLSGIRKPVGTPFATTPDGLRELIKSGEELLSDLEENQIIRSFAAVRPNPFRADGESLHDFCIDCPAPGFYSLIGIKSPGLTCADELGNYIAEQVACYLHAQQNSSFNSCRKAIKKTDDPCIVCQCEGITRSEVVEAIRRGASTPDGVKRRVGSGMGPCQGSRCTLEISRILEEARHGAC